MKYYKFHIGDFALATNHLDRIERSIYFDLINRYYDTEKPICPDVAKVAKRIRAEGHEEVVQDILEEFFYQKDGVWHHYRCDDELEKTYTKSAKARASAEKRWNTESNADAMRTHTEGNATHNPLPTTHNPKDNNIRENSSSSSPVPYQKIVKLYHTNLPMCPAVMKITDDRKKHMRARWKDDADSLQYWDDYFQYVAKSRFLTGRASPTNGRTKPFVADIDFLINEANMIKISEGKYNG